MQKINQQKGIIAAILIAIIGLTLVTFWHADPYAPNKTSNQNKSKYATEAEREKAYREYLASLNTDPAASQKIWEKVIDKEDVRKMVEEELKTTQKIVTAEIPDSKLAITQKTGAGALSDYFSATTSLTEGYIKETRTDLHDMFKYPAPDVAAGREAVAETFSLVNQLYQQPVPKEAVAYHKAQVGMYESMLGAFSSYQDSLAQAEKNPWPDSYKAYALSNQYLMKMQNEISSITGKYGSLSITPVSFDFADAAESEQSQSVLAALGLVKEAQAFLLPGVPVTVVGDVPRLFERLLRDILGAVFTKFMQSLLERFIRQIEQNYMISNMLYYYDGVVSAKNVKFYINKYIPDIKEGSVDDKIIKSFIPQIGCKKDTSEQTRQVLRQKAVEYLGFDPSKIDPNDPDLYKKINRIHTEVGGRGLSYETYFQALAYDVSAGSSFAATNELNAPGKKTPIDDKSKIVTSLEAVGNQQLAALIAVFGFGAPNATNGFAQAIGSLIVGVINRFLIKGAKTIKEQDTCLETPQLNPVVDNDFSDTIVPDTPLPQDPSNCDLIAGTCGGVGNSTTGSNNDFRVATDKFTYAVGESAKYSVTGAPPGEQIYWSSTLRGFSTGETDAGYAGQKTDSKGSWSDTGNPWRCEDVGTWMKQAKVGDKVITTYFTVTDNGTCGGGGSGNGSGTDCELNYETWWQKLFRKAQAQVAPRGC